MTIRTWILGFAVPCLFGAVSACSPSTAPLADYPSGGALEAQRSLPQAPTDNRTPLEDPGFDSWDVGAFDIRSGWGTNGPGLAANVSTDGSGLAVSLGQPSTYVAIAQHAEVRDLQKGAGSLALTASVRADSAALLSSISSTMAPVTLPQAQRTLVTLFGIRSELTWHFPKGIRGPSESGRRECWGTRDCRSV